ncbi:hypothetical protein HS7_21310 [Sulfolobales archaeon HS-7]|nr:hypothetical protein HS7_21310 [Sulfolobales archaeon HS-7]
MDTLRDLRNVDETDALMDISKIMNEDINFKVLVGNERMVSKIVDMCKYHEFTCETDKTEDGFIIEGSKRESNTKITFSEEIQLSSSLEAAVKVLADPNILMGTIPQIKAIRRIGETTFMVSIRWLISLETPLMVTYELYRKTGVVKYTAEQRISALRIRFGFDFFVYKDREMTLRITEWYDGPFRFFAEREIKKHLNNFKILLPKIILDKN